MRRWKTSTPLSTGAPGNTSMSGRARCCWRCRWCKMRTATILAHRRPPSSLDVSQVNDALQQLIVLNLVYTLGDMHARRYPCAPHAQLPARTGGKVEIMRGSLAPRSAQDDFTYRSTGAPSEGLGRARTTRARRPPQEPGQASPLGRRHARCPSKKETPMNTQPAAGYPQLFRQMIVRSTRARAGRHQP